MSDLIREEPVPQTARDGLTIGHLQAFAEVAAQRSIQAAARVTGRSRTTYLRYLDEIREAFDAPILLQRAAGQRVGVLTPEGEELARRARSFLEQWQRWLVTTGDVLGQTRGAIRVGALPGSFDLIADLLSELRATHPHLLLRVVEYPDDDLLDAVDSGAVDLGFGTIGPAGPPTQLAFEALGALPWAVILPSAMRSKFPTRLRLRDLDGVPLVVPRAGPGRQRLERYFAEYDGGPVTLNPAFEVGSTPRIVEMVARGFGPALVSRFRLAFLPHSVTVAPLLDGPTPLSAGVFTRKGSALPGVATQLVRLAKRRFRELSRQRGPVKSR